MRRLALTVLVALLSSACAASTVGSFRADGTPAEGAWQPPAPEGFHRSDDHGSRTEGVVACLGTGVVVGGAGAIIYLTRFRGRGRGGGGDVPAEGAQKPLLVSEDEAPAATGPSRCGAPCGEDVVR